MQTKKQRISFKCVDRNKQIFFTSDLRFAIGTSIEDPIAVNRKTRRAMPKMLKKLFKRV